MRALILVSAAILACSALASCDDDATQGNVAPTNDTIIVDCGDGNSVPTNQFCPGEADDGRDVKNTDAPVS